MKKMLVLGFFLTFSLIASVPRTEFSSPSAYLVIEALNDNVFHFEVAAGKSPGTKKPLWVSPMVSKQPDTYSGPAQFNRSSDSVETTGYRIDVSKTDLCFSIYDKSKHTALTTFCPEKVNDDWKGMSFDSGFMTNVYGLGQYMTNVRTADGDWLSRPAGSRVWEPGPYGNVMEHHGELGGSPGKVMFPVIFAIGNRNDETLYYAFFLDNHYRQRWDFSKKHSKWRVDMYGDQMRGFFLVGKNFMDLRHQFMELVGRPQIPPKSIFGLWMSEFGYESWGEMGGILSLLRKERFP
ncbi:MAG: hypothetical protein HY537_17425, partial [Deltaproteobacteria bacterium]|nr:hypothetical protein [Deltaproteobacteria bacterium]